MGQIAPLRVLVFPAADDGCTWYRQKLFTIAAARRDDIQIAELSDTLEEDQIDELMRWGQVIYIRASNFDMARFIQFWRWKYPHLAVVADTDDELFDVHPANKTSYVSIGVSEVLDQETNTWLYKDLVDGFDSLKNMKNQAEYLFVATRADAMTCTTERLAATLRPYSPNTRIVPNAVDPYYLPKLELPKPKDTLKIIWSGGSSHHNDLWMVFEPLTRILERHKNVELHFAGQRFGWYSKFPQDQFTFHPWIKADGQGFRLACQNADIGICPLEDMSFNHKKSCVKWYEYSALSMATVASHVPPYNDEIEHNQTGLLARNPKDFEDQLERLITDATLRDTIATKAYAWVMENRHIDTVCDTWVAVLKDAYQRRQTTLKEQPVPNPEPSKGGQ